LRNNDDGERDDGYCDKVKDDKKDGEGEEDEENIVQTVV
jgi:hypothetical protein